MDAKVICLASAKGGSGKTVITATLGTYLAALGKRVLLVDTDAATNGLTLLHLKEVLARAEQLKSEGRKPRGVYELDQTVIYPDYLKLPAGYELVPATFKFENTERTDTQSYSSSLFRALEAFRSEYDYIFLDAQAGSDPFAGISMSRKASDEVIIVTEYDPISAAGVERLKGLFPEDLTYVRTWILLNKMLPEFVRSFSDFLEVAKYLSPIPWDADVVRAYARRKLALDIENVNEFTLAIGNTVRSLLGEEIEADIARWSESKQKQIREPIHQRYLDAEQELRGLIYASKELDTRRFRRRILLLSFISLAVAGIAELTWLYPPFRSFLESFLTPLKVANVWLVAPALIGLLLPVVMLILRQWFSAPSAREESERRRLERQQRLLEEHLTKLESLEGADIKELIRARDVRPTLEIY